MTKSPIFLAIGERTAYNSSMKSSYTNRKDIGQTLQDIQYITNYLYSQETHIKPLSHSGKSMLSGMTPKPSAVTDKEMKVFLANGGEIKVIKSRKVRRHNLKSKSSRSWGYQS